jgi:hypothetical protein
MSGFGLIELLVSISIMVLVIGTIIARHTAFNSASLLRSQTWDVALTVREVQLTAISAANLGGGFREVYGVHLNTAVGNNQNFVIFKDASPANNYFYTSADTLLGVQGSLDRRFEISAIRSYLGAGSSSHTALSITFERPNYDARFRIDGGSDLNADRVEIDVRVVDGGSTRTIEITQTGQISVKNSV